MEMGKLWLAGWRLVVVEGLCFFGGFSGLG